MATTHEAVSIDQTGARPGMRTPLYPLLSLVGIVLAVSPLLPWASITGRVFGDAGAALDETVAGLDAGGWGAAAIVAGLAIAVLGLIGYFVNPYSDPEAIFITGFGAATLVAAIWKLVDPASLFDLDVRFGLEDVDGDELDGVRSALTDAAGASVGLWVVLLAGLLSIAGGLWILASRPAAERRID